VREFSVPIMVETSDSANAVETIYARAAERPDAVVFRRAGTGEADAAVWRDVTAAEFADQVTALVKGLIATGVEPGDRVALMCRTSYEWTLIDYAILAAGAVTVPIYETSSGEQVDWICRDSEVKVIFVETEQHEQVVESVRGKLPGLATVWRIDGGALDRIRAAGEAGDAAAVAAEAERRRSGRGPGDLATIIYTSGTTGRPKGCEITHGNFVATARNVVRGPLAEVFGTGREAGSTLLFLPLAHSFARLIQVGAVEAGVTLGLTPNMRNPAPDLLSYQPTFLLAVPRVFEKVYNRAEQKATSESKVKGRIFHAAASTAIAYSQALDAGGPGLGLRLRHALFDRLVYVKLRAAIGGRVTHMVSGGAALGERLGHFFRGVGITICEGYGLTETTAPATVNPPGANKIGTVGRPLPGVSIRVADDGEVLVKGPNVFRGYWHNEQATKEVLDQGWFHTGDVGELDDEGYLRITGRKKEILVTAAGKNVAPAPMEDRLRAHPLISQCMVVGDGRPFVGCLITLDAEALDPWKEQHGKSGTPAELRDDPDLLKEIQTAVDDVNSSVSRAESIKKFRILEVDFTEEAGHLSLKASVKRHVVAKDFAAEIDALYG
jgi:long-chain acyl-CoA synthetase